MTNNRELLTQPGEPSQTFPNDNIYGDLIVHSNDVISDSNENEYIINRFLGKGQFGLVFHVTLRSNQGHYAMKISKRDPRLVQLSIREFNIIRHIHQNSKETSNIIQLLNHFDFLGHICIVMPLFSYDLYDVLQRRQYKGLDLILIQTVMQQILKALVALREAEIVHSDIKPENILLADANSLNVKLIDFGSAREMTQPSYHYVQSRYYRAPEVVLGVDHDHKIDIWSLGCVAFELFLGMPLFPGQSEVHLLHLQVKCLGDIPPTVIQRSHRRDEFFTPNGKLKSEEQICRERNTVPVVFQHYFLHSKIPDLILGYNRDDHNTLRMNKSEKEKRGLFVDFLLKMLTLEPNDRPDASQALQLSFITTDLTTI